MESAECLSILLKASQMKNLVNKFTFGRQLQPRCCTRWAYGPKCQRGRVNMRVIIMIQIMNNSSLRLGIIAKVICTQYNTYTIVWNMKSNHEITHTQPCHVSQTHLGSTSSSFLRVKLEEDKCCVRASSSESTRVLLLWLIYSRNLKSVPFNFSRSPVTQ